MPSRCYRQIEKGSSKSVSTAVVASALILIASTAYGQPASDPVAAEPTRYSDLMSAPVPVTAADITDREYCVIGPVKKEVRKATVFSKASSPAKVRRELWESAKKKGADGVINFESGNSRITGISWGATPVKGTMVTFTVPGIGCPTPAAEQANR